MVSSIHCRIRIRLGLGFRMETWSGSVKPGEDPCPQLLHQTGTSNYLNPIGLQKIQTLAPFFAIFFVVPQRHHSQQLYVIIFGYVSFFKIPTYVEKNAKPGGGLGGADGSTRRRRVVHSGDAINSEGGRTRRRQGNVTLMWFVSFFLGQENDFCFFLLLISTLEALLPLNKSFNKVLSIDFSRISFLAQNDGLLRCHLAV